MFPKKSSSKPAPPKSLKAPRHLVLRRREGLNYHIEELKKELNKVSGKMLPKEVSDAVRLLNEFEKSVEKFMVRKRH